MIKAQIVADSINQFGNRLTTFVLDFPRIVLAEFNTHRMISKNSASSRAIPPAKMLKMVQENPFIPIRWMKEHSGMQGVEYFTSEESVQKCLTNWLNTRDFAVQAVNSFSCIEKKLLDVPLEDGTKYVDVGLTKQVVNRLLEPFMWHRVICTGTEWENFFSLRAESQAEIHIQELAYRMLETYNKSAPQFLRPGEWHIPFGDNFNIAQVASMYNESKEGLRNDGLPSKSFCNDLYIKVATARCARVSYTVVGEEGKPDNYKNDIRLYDRLLQSGHMSPFEHVGRSMNDIEHSNWSIKKRIETGSSSFNTEEKGWCGNFRGFVQYRKMLSNENRKDNRVIKQTVSA